jgi:hypothetical protein
MDTMNVTYAENLEKEVKRLTELVYMLRLTRLEDGEKLVTSPSLRDQIATAAMQALIGSVLSASDVADRAYWYADQMLKQRGKPCRK